MTRPPQDNLHPSTQRLGASWPVLAAILAVGTFILFWPVHSHQFVNYDDGEYITENPHLRGGLAGPNIRWAFGAGYAANWHPLTWLSHMLDVQLFGLNPAGHHMMNAGLHALNAALLFLLLNKLTGTTGRSFFVAALFAWHPLRVESVAWASERKDVLSGFFFLLTLLAYERYAKLKSEGRRRWITYALSLLWFALGLMCKPMLVTVPFVLLLVDIWPLKRFTLGETPTRQSKYRAVARLVLEKVPFLLLAAIVSLVTCLVQKGAMTYHSGLPGSARAANALISCVRYLQKFFWPENLAVFYPHPAHWPIWQTAAAAALLCLISIAAILGFRRRPYVLVGWLWFVGMLVPVLGLVQVGMQSMADRYTYLPSIGVCIALVWLVAELTTRMPRLASAAIPAGCLALIACCVTTRYQLQFWNESETLFSRAALVTKDNWVAQLNLAVYAFRRHLETQRSSIGQQLLQPANNSNAPPVPPAARDYLSETISHAQESLHLRYDDADAHVILAKALVELGQLEEARPHLEIAIRLNPKNPDAHQTLADIFHRQGRAKEAIAEYEIALQLKTGWDSVLNNLAWLLATHPDPEVRNGAESLRLAQEACSITSHTNLWYLHTLAAAYAEDHKWSEATKVATEAERLAEASGISNVIATAQSRVRQYEQKQPLRSP